MANRVYVPQDVNVQMPSTKEYPGGRVVQLKQGWVELDKDMQDHPVLSRLMGDTPGAGKRTQRLADAERKYNEACSAAAQEYAEAQTAVAQEGRDEQLELANGWMDRKNKADAKGLSFNEPHPDLDTRRAQALTGQPAHVFASAGMEQRPLADEERKKERDNLESDSDKNKRQVAVNQTEPDASGTRRVVGRGAKEED